MGARQKLPPVLPSFDKWTDAPLPRDDHGSGGSGGGEKRENEVAGELSVLLHRSVRLKLSLHNAIGGRLTSLTESIGNGGSQTGVYTHTVSKRHGPPCDLR